MTDAEDANSQDDDGRNRRRHERVELPLLVQYRFGALEAPRFDYALNVSRSGLFIGSDEQHDVGTRVFVQVTTRDGAHFLQGEGTVVRQTSGGCAIELDGFAAEDRAVMENLVQEALDQREKLGVGPGSKRDG